ncbi:MAG: substrate-binding domain-containing protein [Rikenellaceae bacterium]|jgi:phosphate transport system substrate-binding protein|nr:substrate-binding domain-containing protein [Rikenellaceae bacterium]
MNRITKYLLLTVAVAAMTLSCREWRNRQTPTRGSITVMVDQTVYPIMLDEVDMFGHTYKYTHIELLGLPGQTIVDSLMHSDSLRVAIMARDLTENEKNWFENRRVRPCINEIAYDAIALIANRANGPKSISEQELKDILTGTANPRSFKLVFDNSHSSTVQYMMEFAGVDSLPATWVFSASSTLELMEHLSKNVNSIGFIGVNWLYEPDGEVRRFIDKVGALSVGSGAEARQPTQNNIAEGSYPFVRTIRIVNCQGNAGLGLGLASFVAGDVGQRIILKSGLTPFVMPKREINVREKI